MKQTYFFFLLLFSVFFSCTTQKNNQEKINTKVNKEYIASCKTFYGKLNPDELKNIQDLISKELKRQIPVSKSIVINYYQYGTSCFECQEPEKVLDNEVEISTRISKNLNAADFFIYTNNYIHKDRLEKRENFIKDSGFFAKNIFTIHENCQGFFILKPNGEFMKYYGFDYFTEVREYLEKNKN